MRMIELRPPLECGAPPAPERAPVPPRSFRSDDQGVAALEFALILPLMLMIYLGLVEVSKSLRAAQRVDLVAHTLADLTAQKLTGGAASGQAGMTNADFQDVFSAGTLLLTPLPATGLKMTITEVNITSPTATTWQAKATWTVTKNSGAVARPCTVLSASDAAPITSGAMPTSYTQVTNGVNPVTGPVIVADVSYVYSSGINFTFQFFSWLGWHSFSNVTFNRTSYSPVRNTYSPPHIQYVGSITGGTNCP